MTLVKRCRRHNGRLHKIRTMRMRQAGQAEGGPMAMRRNTGWQPRERPELAQAARENQRLLVIQRELAAVVDEQAAEITRLEALVVAVEEAASV